MDAQFCIVFLLFFLQSWQTFEVESDEEGDRDDEHPCHMMNLNSSAEDGKGNGRVRGTLGLTALRSSQRWNGEGMYHGDMSSGGCSRGPSFMDESSSAGHGRGPLFLGESSSAGRGHGPQYVGESSSTGAGRGRVENESEPERVPLFDGVFVFRIQSCGGRGRLGLSGRGRGSCPPLRGAAGAGHGAAGRGGRGSEAAGRGDRGIGAASGRVGRGRGAHVWHGARGRGAGAGRGAAGVGHGDAGGDDQEAGGQDNGPVLPLGRLVSTRRVYSDEDKRKIYVALLRRTSPELLNDGVTKAVAAEFMLPLRVVQRVWFDGLDRIENICNKKPLNCWHRRVDFDPQAITQVPPSKRRTLKDLAYELGVSKTTLWRRFKEKQFRRHSNAIKPRITDDNKKARVRYALSTLDPDSAEPKFQGM